MNVFVEILEIQKYWKILNSEMMYICEQTCVHCMHVLMYVYVCMYLCIYVCLHVHISI